MEIIFQIFTFLRLVAYIKIAKEAYLVWYTLHRRKEYFLSLFMLSKIWVNATEKFPTVSEMVKNCNVLKLVYQSWVFLI